MRRKSAVIVVILLIALCGVSLVGYWRGEERYKRFMNEVYGFRKLDVLAREMIDKGSIGVVNEAAGGRRIRSFGDFFAYVRKVRPSDVAQVDSPNPFPGILPGKSYRHLCGDTNKDTDELLRTEERFERPWGSVRVWLRADGQSMATTQP